MSKKLTTEEFIKKAKKIHKNKYNYSLVEYKNCNIKINIICEKHGIFEQTPNKHIYAKHGCQKCKGGVLKTTEEFIKKAQEIHKNKKFNYSLVEYKNCNTPVIIICDEHGKFEQTPNDHFRYSGCWKCYGKLNTEEFIKLSNEIHNKKYDYSLVNYDKYKNEVSIICKKHGIFKQKPSYHLKGSGCQNCKNSLGENKIFNFLIKNNVDFIQQKRFADCKYKYTLPFDFYLPKYNLCIEYDGKQHFKPIKKFGGEQEFKERKIKDKIKTEYCKKNNIKLLRIKYNENIEEKLNSLFLQT